LAFTGKIYFCILNLGLGSVAFALHVSGLGLLALALTLLALLHPCQMAAVAATAAIVNTTHNNNPLNCQQPFPG